MRVMSASDARQRFGAVIDTAQREPVVIRRLKRDVAVVLSKAEYDRLGAFNVAELEALCDSMADRARAQGLTGERLANILADD